MLNVKNSPAQCFGNTTDDLKGYILDVIDSILVE